MARTDDQWEVGIGGGYIQTIAPNGYDLLINGANHYINFNNLSGSTGYGVRDNSGTMEFKNSGGSWSAFVGSGDLSGYVPYVGATTDVNLGSHTLQLGQIIDDTVSHVASIDPNNRYLRDASGVITINYASHTFYDASGGFSGDWDNRVLYDNSLAVSIDWLNRFLQNSSNETTLDWGSQQLLAVSGLTTVTSLNWVLRQVFNSSSVATFDWQNLAFPTLTTNGVLVTSGGTGAISIDTGYIKGSVGSNQVAYGQPGGLTGSSDFIYGVTSSTFDVGWSGTNYFHVSGGVTKTHRLGSSAGTNIQVAEGTGIITAIGALSVTGTINKVTITAPATGSTLTIIDGKTLTASNSITLAGTDSTTMTFPATSAAIARTDTGQTFTGSNTFSGTTTSVQTTNFTSTSTTITLGSNSAASTLGLGTGATTTGVTKAVNIGTAGVSGSTTNIIIGTSSGGTSNITLNGHVTVEGVTSTGATGTGNFVFSSAPSLSGAVTFTGSANLAASVNLAASNTSIIGGNLTTTQTVSYATGATASGQTKTINMGTGAVAGGITMISIGSTLGTSTIALNGTTTAAGDLKLGTAGNGLYIKEGTNATMGTGTLSAGTLVVSTTKVTANSRIFISDNGGTVTNLGTLYISARTAGTSFTVSSTNILDASTFAWIIIEPA